MHFLYSLSKPELDNIRLLLFSTIIFAENYFLKQEKNK